MKNPFTDHPKDVGETYFEHFGVASGFGLRMMVGGFACMIHGIFPFLFVKTGSREVQHLHDIMVRNRRRNGCAEDDLALDLTANPHARFTHAVFSEL